MQIIPARMQCTPVSRNDYMHMRLLLIFCFCTVFLLRPVSASGQTFSTEELMEGFDKTVFGLEYRSWSWRPYLVKKFTTPVRFYVHNHSLRDRRKTVRRFVKEIGNRIGGLTTDFATDAESANLKYSLSTGPSTNRWSKGTSTRMTAQECRVVASFGSCPDEKA